MKNTQDICHSSQQRTVAGKPKRDYSNFKGLSCQKLKFMTFKWRKKEFKQEWLVCKGWRVEVFSFPKQKKKKKWEKNKMQGSKIAFGGKRKSRSRNSTCLSTEISYIKWQPQWWKECSFKTSRPAHPAVIVLGIFSAGKVQTKLTHKTVIPSNVNSQEF